MTAICTTSTKTEIRKRGFFGKIFKLLFFAFNILMVISILSFWSSVRNHIDHPNLPDQLTNLYFNVHGVDSDAVTVGAGILDTTIILFFWMIGDAILGLICLSTRGKKIIIETTNSPLTQN